MKNHIFGQEFPLSTSFSLYEMFRIPLQGKDLLGLSLLLGL